MVQFAIIVTGSRDWTGTAQQHLAIRKRLGEYPRGTILLHGNCQGVDVIAAEIAKRDYGFNVIPVNAFWGYGPSGGPQRNAAMLAMLLGLQTFNRCTIAVEAFHEDITNSKGTKNMVDQSHKAGVKTVISF